MKKYIYLHNINIKRDSVSIWGHLAVWLQIANNWKPATLFLPPTEKTQKTKSWQLRWPRSEVILRSNGSQALACGSNLCVTLPQFNKSGELRWPSGDVKKQKLSLLSRCLVCPSWATRRGPAPYGDMKGSSHVNKNKTMLSGDYTLIQTLLWILHSISEQ